MRFSDLAAANRLVTGPFSSAGCFRRARRCSTMVFAPGVATAQLNDIFELAFDFLAACYLAFGCPANRLYVRASARYFGLDLLTFLRFLLRP
jgi:hypothetical protein